MDLKELEICVDAYSDLSVVVFGPVENMSCFSFGEPVAASHATLCPAILAPDMGEVSVEFCQGSIFIICCGFFNKCMPVVHQTCFSSNSLCVRACVRVCVCVYI